MPECVIAGIPVNFPFEPYDVQKAYMTKVIECLESKTNGILESPTGTGKTLSLLCSTLAWIQSKKTQMQNNIEQDFQNRFGVTAGPTVDLTVFKALGNVPNKSQRDWSIPKIIYASRTHSQLSQAMQELKKCSYSYMRAVILGSRDQLCIHPEVSKEQNNASKIQMCKIRVTTRSCFFYQKVEANKDHPTFRGQTVMDIEDLVQVGQKLKMCPYFSSKELVQDADIIFMPYNYLLDPKARQANKVELNNTIVILDEAHNVEKMCEEAASVQLKSSDIALCIDDITQVMKSMVEDADIDLEEGPKDFNLEDLALLKERFLELEKAIDDIEVTYKTEGITYPGEFIFELLAKANVNAGNQGVINRVLDNIIQFLAMASQGNAAFRKGAGLQIFSDLLTIVFAGKDEEAMQKVKKCFKVHIELEETKQKAPTSKGGWQTTKTNTLIKSAKIINYWCFSPGFGMESLLTKNVRSIILTSGTLAPLKPLIAELAIPISARLENPHIVNKSQVCVKIVSCGPDKEILNSSYKNRDNPKYVSSLGRTILSFCPVIPDGLLVFFPSYPVMNKCVESWQASGIWSQINRHKPVFVEPRGKDAFLSTMTDFYSKINDPTTKGACFMAVCRGKVSEGLDFADINGRAVIITGLPYPPLKDPRVVLKKRYLEDNRTKENEFLSGENWYSLEATRAVNQAIGRVIRHKNDYGAILLCDTRFNFPSHKNQLSSWIQGHLNSSQQYTNFGPLIGDLARFFRNARNTLPQPCSRKLEGLEESKIDNKFDIPRPSFESETRKSFRHGQSSGIKIENANEVSTFSPVEYTSVVNGKIVTPMDFMSRLDSNTSTINFNDSKPIKTESPSLVTIHKRDRFSPPESSPSLSNFSYQMKKRKLRLVPNTDRSSSSFNRSGGGDELDIPSSPSSSSSQIPSTSDQNFKPEIMEKVVPLDRSELLKLIKNSVSPEKYSIFVKALMSYQKDNNFDGLFTSLVTVFAYPSLHYLLKGMRRFLKEPHKPKFDEVIQNVVKT